MKRHELARALHLEKREERTELRQALFELENEGKVTCLRKNRWSLPRAGNTLVGKLHMMAKSGAILSPTQEEAAEVFVNDRNVGIALPNDLVEVELFHSEYAAQRRNKKGSAGSLAEGRVIKILERANQRVVGLLRRTPYYSYIIPDAPGFRHDVRIDDPGEVPENHKVLVELEDWTDPYKPIFGRIVEDLGHQDTPGVDVESLLSAAGIEEAFPKEVLQEAENLNVEGLKEEIGNRRDLRDAIIFTIDPETAKDYDDALSIEPHPDGGWILGVHIADVSTFVRPGSQLDKEAFRRGNSIYLVDRAVMMLPKELTTRVCSLNPQNDHLTHSVELHMGEDGALLGYKSFPSIIHSKARLTYKQVQMLIEKQESEEIPPRVQTRLKNLIPLVEKIRARRIQNGSVEINTPEIEIKLNAKGKVEKMIPRSHAKDAYQVVEECMLLANRAVAEILMASEHPALYRVHEEPDEEQWDSMGMELQALGIPKLPRDRKEINEAVKLAKGTPVEYTANLAILRNFKRAEYASEQVGHFGLAFSDYTHFPSPIRRYPDLVVHRILKAIETKAPPPLSKKEIDLIALHCNDTERQADELERKSLERKKLEYYGEILNTAPTTLFEGYIVSIKGKGLIVELPDSLQRGMIPFSALGGEWLEANPEMTQVRTRNGKVRFTLGEKVKVALAKVDPSTRFVDFILADALSEPVHRRRKHRIQPDLKTGQPRRRGKRRRR
jgi:ribonuclease R